MVEPNEAKYRLEARTYEVDELVQHALAGRIRVPWFQRGLKWQWEDVRRLFDSIVRGYPIGSLLLWDRRADAAHIQLGAFELDAPAGQALWVVDGQQRLISLANALSRQGATDRRFSLAYHFGASEFRRPVRDHSACVPLPVLFDLQQLVKWLRDYPEFEEHWDEGTRIAKVIRQYKIPAYVVLDDDEAILRDIFDRMNNAGKRLTHAEVFAALHPPEARVSPDGEPTLHLTSIAARLHALTAFGRLADDTVLQAFLARRGPDPLRDVRVEFEQPRDIPAESRADAYRATLTALEAAVRFLQEEGATPHQAFLPYRYLLVVLARFFAHHREPRRRNMVLLRRWYWRAAVAGPAPFGGQSSAVRALAGCINLESESGSVQALLGKVPRPNLTDHGLPDRFDATSAATKRLLAAMWDRGPRSLTAGAPYTESDLADALKDATTATGALSMVYPEVETPGSRVGNRQLLLADDRSRLQAAFERPQAMNEATWHEVLRSHELEGLPKDRVTALREREMRLRTLYEAFVERMMETTQEDTPPLDDLVVEDRAEERSVAG